MRLWSLHPQYLDSKGLVALWREGLLARAVLEGKTKGYKNHPQLNRFKSQNEPILFLDTYLYHVYLDAVKRGYNFNSDKIGKLQTKDHIPVTDGQIKYEMEHLKRKLKTRDVSIYEKLRNIDLPETNPIFKVIPGEIEKWEKLQ